MITINNLKKMLNYLEFEERESNIFIHYYKDLNCELKIDFNTEKIIYPEEKGLKVNDRGSCNFSENENFVVFECIHRLMCKGYRPEHIEIEKTWSLGHTQKSGRADICVFNPDKTRILAIIECKTSGTEYKRALKILKSDGGQIFSYLQQERSTSWLCLYASNFENEVLSYKNETIYCIDDANIIELSKSDDSILTYENSTSKENLFQTWKQTYERKLWGDLIFNSDTVAYNIGIKAIRKKDLINFKTKDNVMNQFEEILRHNNVSDKENAFNRLLALFICKLVDETEKKDDEELDFQYKQGTDTYESLQERLQRLHKTGMEKFMKEDVSYVPLDYPEWLFSHYTGKRRNRAIDDLRETLRILKFYSNNDFAFKEVHNEKLFYQNGKILVEMVQLFERYKIIYSTKNQFLGDLFEQLLDQGFKQNEGQFFTPTPIARFVWDSLPLKHIIAKKEQPKVIDYACGSSHFLIEAIEAINYFSHNENNIWTRDKIFGIEKDYRLARVSKVAMFMNGAGESNIVFGDGLENHPGENIIAENFDILVANPPYSVSGFKSHLELKDNELNLLDSISFDSGSIEVAFVERAIQLIKHGGIAAIILPASILSTNSAAYIGAREYILKNFKIKALVLLGSETFGATGTNTVIMFLEKYNEPPKVQEITYDIVDEILSGRDLSEWTDKLIFEKYIDEIDVEIDDYINFINKKIQYDNLGNIDYFKNYKDDFLNLTQIKSKMKTKHFKKLNLVKRKTEMFNKLHDYIMGIEREKIYYFALTYDKDTIIVNSPTSVKGQREFLGYQWSKRQGKKGIQINDTGGKLYNQEDRENTEVLSGIIRNNFLNEEIKIAQEYKEIVKEITSSELLDFSNTAFINTINTVNIGKISINSNYPMERLSRLVLPSTDMNVIIEIDSVKEKGKYPVISQASNELISGFTDIEPNKLTKPIVLFGDHSCTFKYIDFDFVRGGDGTKPLVFKDSLIPKYCYYFFLVVSVPNKDKYERHYKYIKEMMFPVPPESVQKELITECEKIDMKYERTRMSEEKHRENIEKKFKKLGIIID